MRDKKIKLRADFDMIRDQLKKLQLAHGESKKLTNRSTMANIHKDALDKHGITVNSYWSTLEGRPSFKFLQHWEKVSEVISSTTYYSLMQPLMAAMYQFFKIVSKSTHIVSELEIDRVEDLAAEIKDRFRALREQWPHVNLKTKLQGKEKRFKDFSLGHKCHSILGHSAEWMRLWCCTPGYQYLRKCV